MPKNLYEFCYDYLDEMKFVFERKNSGNNIHKKDKSRPYNCKNKRKLPYFAHPWKLICFSHLSNDISSFTAHVDHSVGVASIQVTNLQPGQYIACVCDHKWWIGNSCEISQEEYDVLIIFMYSHRISRTFHWPARKDVLHIWTAHYHYYDTYSSCHGIVI